MGCSYARILRAIGDLAKPVGEFVGKVYNWLKEKIALTIVRRSFWQFLQTGTLHAGV